MSDNDFSEEINELNEIIADFLQKKKVKTPDFLLYVTVILINFMARSNASEDEFDDMLRNMKLGFLSAKRSLKDKEKNEQ